MRLIVRCPPGWQELEAEDGSRLVGPGELRVELRGVTRLPEDPQAWIRSQLGEAVIVDTADVELASGWPAFVVEAADADERLLMVVWRFLEYGAAAFAAIPADRYASCREELLAVLGEVTVDWEGQPLLTLAQIWEGFE